MDNRKQRYIQKLRTRDIPAEEKKIVAFLVLETDTVRKYPIKSGINFIGNDKDVDIQLNIPGVSGFHAMIETSDDGLEHFIEDLDSTNGTHLGPSNYPLGAWKLYQLIHKKMLAIGPATGTYQFVDSLQKTGLGEEEEELNMTFTVDSRPFGSPIMIKTKDFLPSDILKEKSSPDSMVILNNQESSRTSCRQEFEDNIQSQTKKQTEESLKYSSDFELELPKHFGRRSNTIDSPKEDLNDIQPLDNLIVVQQEELKTNPNDDHVPVDTTAETHNALEISKEPSREVENRKEIPKKRKLMGKKTYNFGSDKKSSIAMDEKMPKKNKILDLMESPIALNQQTLAKKNVNKNKPTNSKLDLDHDSDESSLDHKTSDQILQEIVKGSNKNKKLDQSSDKCGDKTADDESVPLLVGNSELKIDTDAKSLISEPPSFTKTIKKKEAKAKNILVNKDTSKETSSTSNSDPLIEPRRSSTNSDLSIAIALSGGRGKRAAASKALEKTKDMYHNLPPLFEECVVSKTKKTKDELSEPSTKEENLPASSKKDLPAKKEISQKKRNIQSVKLEPVASSEVKSEPIDKSDFKENMVTNYSIAFTGGSKEDRKPLEAMIRKFGGTVVDSWSDCTHLVTDKIRRTSKFLCALTTGKFIMNPNWLDACKKEGKFIDESLYLLRDETNEKKFKFSLRDVLDQTQNGLRLLKDLRFYATENVQPDHKTLDEILCASGATLEQNRPLIHEPIIILSCLEDLNEIAGLEKLGYHEIQSMEFVLTGLLRQKLDYSRLVDFSKSRRLIRPERSSKKMKDIHKIISRFENESPKASYPPRKPPRVKTLPSYRLPRSDSGINLETKSITTADQSAIPTSNRNCAYQAVSVKKLREIWENVASDNKWKINPKNIKVSDVSDIKSGCGKSLSSSGINKCDMIVCGIKTIIINQVKMHQIELGCHHCDSRFLMTAAHECEKDDDIQDLIVHQDVQPNSLNIIL